MLEMSSLRVMIKKSRGKKQQKETEKQQYIIVRENSLFKGFATEGVPNYDQKQSGKLDTSSHGIPHAVEDSLLVDPQRHLPTLSSLPDYYWLYFGTPFLIKTFK